MTGFYKAVIYYLLSKAGTAIASPFSYFHHNIVEIVTEGDKIAVRINVTGTYKGEF
jgi:predicted ester cyclase